MRRVILFAIVVLLSACATRPPGESSAPRRSGDVITLEEFVDGPWTNAYDIVRALRPRWLSNRNAAPGDPVRAYVDRVPYGTVEGLRNVPVNRIHSIRHYGGPDAQLRFGLDNRGGAIEVTTRTD